MSITITTPPGAITGGMSEAEAAALPLSPKKRIALIKLTQGASYRATGAAVGVTRQTVHDWMKDDPHFQAAFNAWQHDAVQTGHHRLMTGVADAVTAVLDAIHRGDTASAWKLLNAMGVTDRPNPGTTDPGLLNIELQLERDKELLRLRKLKAKNAWDDMNTGVTPPNDEP